MTYEHRLLTLITSFSTLKQWISEGKIKQGLTVSDLIPMCLRMQV